MTKNDVTKYREKKYWSKADLASEAKVAYGTALNIEKGRPSRRENRLKIANALGEKYELVFPDND